MTRLSVLLSCALVVFVALPAKAQFQDFQDQSVTPRRKAAARTRAPRVVPTEFIIDEAIIKGGQLLVTGRTAKPSQVVEILDTGDKTISLPTRRFSFSLTYMPESCRIQVRADAETLKDQVVSDCIRRGAPGKDGIAGKDGRDGKDGFVGRDGRDAFIYGSLPGDGAANACWPSDIIGLWFIKDYPGPNSRTIAHIVPDRAAGGNRMQVTEPDDPLKSGKTALA